MAAVKRASAKGVTGGAGAALGYSSPGARPVERRWKWAGGMEDVEAYFTGGSGAVIADGDFCAWPKVQGQGLQPTPERQAKGDIQFGVWSADGTRAPTWGKADRLAPLFRDGVISREQYLAGTRFAATAEHVGCEGLQSTFGSVKVDGGKGSVVTIVDSVGAGAAVARAMSALGGSSSLMGGTIWLVVACGLSLNTVEAEFKWAGQAVNRKELRGILRAGLDVLARIW